MSFKVTMIGGFNPFEWKDLKCPVCGKSDFVSMSHAGVYCDYCNAKFEVRMTGGDPGCVIDCFVDGIYAPAWKCPECDMRFSSFEESPICPANGNHRKCDREIHISRSWEKPKGYPERYCLVLKTGDYCSSWMNGKSSDRLSHPTEKQWEKFQVSWEKIKPGLGSTIHARYAIITK